MIVKGIEQLQSQLKQDVIDLELQPLLQSLLDHGTIITENFTSYVNAVSAIAGRDAGLRSQGAQDLFQLFSLNNLQQIAVNLTDLQNLLNPMLGAAKSIPQPHLGRFEGVLDAVCSDLDPFKMQAPFPGSEAIVLGSKLWKGLFDAAKSELDIAAGTFQYFAVLQMQGLTLLTTAWIRTDQAAQVTQLVQGYATTIPGLTQFCTAIMQGQDSWPGMDQYLKTKILSNTGAGPACETGVYVWDDVDPTGAPDVPAGWRPVDWILWLEQWCVNQGTITIIYRPWGPNGTLPWGSAIYAGKSALLEYNGMISPPTFSMTIYWNGTRYDVPVSDWVHSAYVLPQSLNFIQGLAAFKLPGTK